ncbi:MAG: hypothetical protein RLZZ227_1576 [Pseudomonadota bacterium]|jgi:SM-20-related protein
MTAPFFVMGAEKFVAGEVLYRVVNALDLRGYCILDDALPASLAAALAQECAAGAQGFKAAGVGRLQDHQLDTRIRSDDIHWLDAVTAASSAYLELMDALRGALNRRLFLGLFDYECHYSRYAPGAFYRKHHDAFAGNRNRVLSTVFYLNEGWCDAEAGELLLYAEDGEAVLETILPAHNRLVLFLSERFLHEVLPTSRARHSIAGWFRIKG